MFFRIRSPYFSFLLNRSVEHERRSKRSEEVVIHEVGHYFGLDDERLRETGE